MLITGRTPSDPSRVIIGLVRIPIDTVAEITTARPPSATRQVSQQDARDWMALPRNAVELARCWADHRPHHAHANVVAGRRTPLVGEAMWLDSALTQAAGIPTVVYGPGGAGAHAVDEYVDLDSVRTCAQVLLQTAADFCS